MAEKQIPSSKVMDLGIAGVKVMTGTSVGVTKFVPTDNSMLLNYHCIAHKLDIDIS